VWNQIPVTLGNIVGGALFTGIALYATYKPTNQMAPMSSVAPQVPAE
jgi:formate/nitrite transporter FocA (FNT family)